MTETLPKTFPAELSVDGKKYKYLSPDEAVRVGMSSGSQMGYKKWHYYVSEKVYDNRNVSAVGKRRHFTIFIGGANRKNASIHISIKSSEKNPINNFNGEAHFWFQYGDQKYQAAKNWKSVAKNRAQKLETLFGKFVKALTAVDSPVQKTVPDPPPFDHTTPLSVGTGGDAWDTAKEFPEGVRDEPKPKLMQQETTETLPDSWEDDL